MEIFSTIIIAIALAMDSFTISISGGASLKKVNSKDALTVGLYFGLFQMLMTLVGWKSGQLFSTVIDTFDHWIALGILVIVGGKMIYHSFSETNNGYFSLSHRILALLAVATSIDALGIGLSYALLDKQVFYSSLIIGITAFFFSAFGLYLGKKLKKILKNKAELLGGVILILIGLKIAYDHGVFNF